MASRSQRLDATITIGSVLERSVGRNINVLRKGLDSVGDEIKGITDRQRELSRQRRVLERQGQSVDELDREYQQLGDTLDALRGKQERYERAQGAANRVGRQFADVAGRIGSTARNAGIAVGAVGTAAFGIANSAAAAGREIRIMSQLSNAGTDEFQRFAAAGKSVGFEQDKMADILKDVNDRIGDFNETGGGPMADFFENIGPKVGVTAEHFKNLSGPQALQLYVSSLEQAGLSQQEMTFYMEAMASDSTALIPLLRDNGREMKALGDEAAETGAILNNDAIAASERFSRQLGRSKTALLGVKNTIGIALLPVIGDMADQFTAFVVENRPQIEQFAQTFSEGFRAAVPIIGEVLTGLGDFAGKVGAAAVTVADFVGGWENFGIALGAVMASPAIVAIGGLVVTVGKLGTALASLAAPSVLPVISSGIAAVGAAIAATPIGLLTAGAAAVAGGAYLIYQNWDGVKDFFGNLFGSVIDTLGGFGQFVGGIFTGNLTSAVDGIKLAWQGWRDTIATILNGIGATFTAVWTDLIKPVTDKLGVTEPIVAGWNAARDGIGSAVNFVGEKLTAFKDAVVTPFVEYMSGIDISAAWDGIKTAIGGVLDWMGAKFDWVLEKIRPVLDALSWVGDKGAGIVGSVTGFFGGDGEVSGGSGGRAEDRDKSANPEKKLAIGGALSANKLTLVGERGPELIYPNQGGFVAHNRALERMVDMSSSIGAAINTNAAPMIAMPEPAPLDLSGIMSAPEPRAAQGGGSRVSNVTQQITINAPQSMDIPSLVAELKRLQQQAQNDALFDGATDWGQYA